MRHLISSFIKFFLICVLLMNVSCNKNQKSNSTEMQSYQKGTYGDDLQFLQKHKKPIELQNGGARVLISPEYQGRVMTSSASGESGLSFGWINHNLIESGEVKEHINAVGGEERFWLGPEGGQFSIFFNEGSTFEFENWQTPPAIDTEAFDLVQSSEKEAEFSKSVQITNYSGFQFNFDVNRKISLLDIQEIKNELGIVFQ